MSQSIRSQSANRYAHVKAKVNTGRGCSRPLTHEDFFGTKPTAADDAIKSTRRTVDMSNPNPADPNSPVKPKSWVEYVTSEKRNVTSPEPAHQETLGEFDMCTSSKKNLAPARPLNRLSTSFANQQQQQPPTGAVPPAGTTDQTPSRWSSKIYNMFSPLVPGVEASANKENATPATTGTAQKPLRLSTVSSVQQTPQVPPAPHTTPVGDSSFKPTRSRSSTPIGGSWVPFSGFFGRPSQAPAESPSVVVEELKETTATPGPTAAEEKETETEQEGFLTRLSHSLGMGGTTTTTTTVREATPGKPSDADGSEPVGPSICEGTSPQPTVPQPTSDETIAEGKISSSQQLKLPLASSEDTHSTNTGGHTTSEETMKIFELFKAHSRKAFEKMVTVSKLEAACTELQLTVPAGAKKKAYIDMIAAYSKKQQQSDVAGSEARMAESPAEVPKRRSAKRGRDTPEPHQQEGSESPSAGVNEDSPKVSWTVAKLVQFAEDRGIDLGKAKKKQAILAALKKHLE